jgi:two-component system LytT family response regulator
MQSPYTLMVKADGRTCFLDAARIDWCHAEGNYVRVYAARESYKVRTTITRMEAALAAHRFVRIHRSALVNIDGVRQMQCTDSGGYAIILRNGVALRLARSHRKEFCAHFNRLRDPDPDAPRRDDAVD